MSNFDFGGGPTQGYTPPLAHQVPQPVSQGTPAAPPGQPQQPQRGVLPQGRGPQQPVPPAAPVDGGTGITPVGIIAILALLALMLGLAFLGNRVWPINSRIDSAWRGLDGNAAELTTYLRGEGFTCSDENTLADAHFHRLCARYDAEGKVSVEFAGPRTGEVMRVYARSDGQWTPAARAAAERAIDLSVPDQTSQQAARAILAAGTNSTQSTKGPWGQAGFVDGVFTVARTWSGPGQSALIPGDLALVRSQAETQGYVCDSVTPMVCTRTANGGNWKVTVTESTNPMYLASITLDASVTDPNAIDPAKEIEVVLPPSAERNKLSWFVSTADQATGQAGFARGLVTDYRVSGSRVFIRASTPCRVDSSGTPSC